MHFCTSVTSEETLELFCSNTELCTVLFPCSSLLKIIIIHLSYPHLCFWRKSRSFGSHSTSVFLLLVKIKAEGIKLFFIRLCTFQSICFAFQQQNWKSSKIIVLKSSLSHMVETTQPNTFNFSFFWRVKGAVESGSRSEASLNSPTVQFQEENKWPAYCSTLRHICISEYFQLEGDKPRALPCAAILHADF